jgi:hypothetical protein
VARHFTAASSEKITLAIGALGFAFGPATAAVICRFTTLPVAGTELISLDVNSTNKWYFYVEGGSHKCKLQCNAGQSLGATVLTTGKWYCLVGSKATGTVAPRFHIYDYSAGTWTHENGASSIANSGTPVTSAILGWDSGGSAGWALNGDIAAAGVWNVAFTDQQVEPLPLTLQGWFAPAQPRALWVLDQDAVTQKVVDMSGGGAGESARSGTSVSTVSVPVFSYGHQPLVAS